MVSRRGRRMFRARREVLDSRQCPGVHRLREGGLFGSSTVGKGSLKAEPVERQVS
jgi:hypothetical protein